MVRLKTYSDRVPRERLSSSSRPLSAAPHNSNTRRAADCRGCAARLQPNRALLQLLTVLLRLIHYKEGFKGLHPIQIVRIRRRNY